jgi:acyl-CoA synthetase (AMP-forming)/AMP-acid ligase II
MSPKIETVSDILGRLENCTRFGARFVSPSEHAEFYAYCEVVRRARASAAYLQARGLKPGDHVAVILSSTSILRACGECSRGLARAT